MPTPSTRRVPDGFATGGSGSAATNGFSVVGSSAPGGASASNGNPDFAVYVPLQVNQSDQTTGSTPSGTVATVSTVSPGFVPQFDPTSPFANQDGLIASPNVDLASQFVQLLTAKYSFAANAKVIQAYNDTQQSLLDITT